MDGLWALVSFEELVLCANGDGVDEWSGSCLEGLMDNKMPR